MLLRILAFLAAVSLASPAIADEIVFSNFGPGDSYYNLGWNLAVGSGLPLGEDIDHASAFTPDGNFNLTEIELAAGLVSGPNLLDVWLMTDTDGQPGTIIESFHFVDAMGSLYADHAILSADSTLHPLLSADTQYWLVASVPGPDEYAGWNQNSVGDVGPNAFRTNLGPWYVYTDPYLGTRSAFRIDGSPVVTPEPNALLLVSVGLVVVAALRRRILAAKG